eukprot:UN03497
MFVPYMDTSKLWYYKSYFDVGEYGLGLLSQTLNSQICGNNAHYFSMSTLDGPGNLIEYTNVACVLNEQHTIQYR